MDILIQDSWLREYLKTDATPPEIQKYLSLCGPSVERLSQIEGEILYHIEVTTNRVTDSACVRGIAREAAAILPRFGKAAKFVDKKIPVHKYFPAKNTAPYLSVKIEKSELCPRFAIILLRDVSIKQSPRKIQERLMRNGLRPLNNIIDVTNYLMLELGQPAHVFDYDEIKGQKMILREARAGEKIQTLDGVVRTLPAGAIVIEDGEERLIDLCGIMGGWLSQTKNNSHNILLFVQNYDPARTRKTCQALSFRTDAAALFEKWVDPEGVSRGMTQAIEMISQFAKPRKIEPVIDIYPEPVVNKKVKCPMSKLQQLAGEKIPQQEIIRILNALEIKSKISRNEISCEVPTFRSRDIEIPEDIIEEVVRVYGYFNLTGKLPENELPQIIAENNNHLQIEKKIKDACREAKLTEVYTYSMISQEDLIKTNCLEKPVILQNPLTEDAAVMRPSFLPSILKVVAENEKNEKQLAIFEMSNIYLNRGGRLPQEKMQLVFALQNQTLSDFKGKLEYILGQIGILDWQMEKNGKENQIFNQKQSFTVLPYGIVGFINQKFLFNYGIKNDVLYAELDVSELCAHSSTRKKFSPVGKYPEAYEDLCLITPEQTYFADIEKIIKKQSSLIKKLMLLDSYGKTITVRIIYQSEERNINEEDISFAREKILQQLEASLKIKLKN